MSLQTQSAAAADDPEVFDVPLKQASPEYTRVDLKSSRRMGIIERSKEAANNFDLSSVVFDPTQKRIKRETIFEHFLHEGDLVLWVGRKKAEKSLFAERLGMHIAAGKNWYGHRCEQARKVAYLDAENSTDDIDDRFVDLLKEFTAAEQVLIRQNFKIVKGREWIDAGGSLDYLDERWWENYTRLTSDAEVHILDCLYMFHDKEAHDNGGLAQVIDVLKYRMSPANGNKGKTLILPHHARSMSNDDLKKAEGLSLRRLGAQSFSEQSYGGKVLLKKATLVICNDKVTERDDNGAEESWHLDVQFFGRSIQDSPLMRFEADDEKYKRRLIRELSPGAARSIAELSLACGENASWDSLADAAVFMKCSKASAYRHLDELLVKEYLVQEWTFEWGNRFHLRLSQETAAKVEREERLALELQAAKDWLASYLTGPEEAENVIIAGDEVGHERRALIQARRDLKFVEFESMDGTGAIVWRRRKKRGGYAKNSSAARAAASKRWHGVVEPTPEAGPEPTGTQKAVF